jgi:hypothetical protein
VPDPDVLEALASDVAALAVEVEGVERRAAVRRSPAALATARAPLHGVHSAAMLVVAGTRVAREDALALAHLLSRNGSDHTARILLEAVVRGRVFVALTPHDRECLLAVLDRPPPAFVDLRRVLFDELNWQRPGLTPPPRPGGIAGPTGRSNGEPMRVAWV